MLILHQRLLSVPILSLQTGAPLGYTKEIIIDPRQLKVVAFYCEGQHIAGPAVLHTSDIREFSPLGIIVDDADSLMPPDQLVRLQEVLDFRFDLLGKPVIDTQKLKLGKVEDFSVDAESFFVIKLQVRQSLLKNFMGANALIDRNQIVEVTDKQIVVHGNEVRHKAAEHASAIIQNPFRTPQQTRPNTIESDRN